MSKKFLACFLSIAMVLSQAQEIATNTYAVDTVGITNTPSKGLSKTTKVALGVGSGLLAVIGIPMIAWRVCKYRENATERIMRWVIDSKNENLKNETEYLDWQLWEECRQKGLYPESVFAHVTKNSANIAACYYGKDAFRNCIADATSNDPQKSYEHSNHIVWYDLGASSYVFGEPDCGVAVQDGLKRFVEFGNRIYEAIYVQSDGIITAPSLRIINLARGNVSKGESTTYYGNVWIDESGKVMFGRNDSEWYHKPYDEIASSLVKYGIFDIV